MMVLHDGQTASTGGGGDQSASTGGGGDQWASTGWRRPISVYGAVVETAVTNRHLPGRPISVYGGARA